MGYTEFVSVPASKLNYRRMLISMPGVTSEIKKTFQKF
jgi:hypothetical protein